MSDFILDSRLDNDCDEIVDLEFCRCLLMNDVQYPWVILVPQIKGLEEIYELNNEQQQLLWKEIALVSKVMKELFCPLKLNIGALGNIVRQLHIHIVARFENDQAWPGPVWGAHPRVEYSEDKKRQLIKQLKLKLVS